MDNTLQALRLLSPKCVFIQPFLNWIHCANAMTVSLAFFARCHWHGRSAVDGLCIGSLPRTLVVALVVTWLAMMAMMAMGSLGPMMAMMAMMTMAPLVIIVLLMVLVIIVLLVVSVASRLVELVLVVLLLGAMPMATSHEAAPGAETHPWNKKWRWKSSAPLTSHSQTLDSLETRWTFDLSLSTNIHTVPTNFFTWNRSR